MNIFKKKNKNVLTRIFRKKSKLEKFYLKNEEFIKYSFVSTVCTGILFGRFNNKRKLLIGKLFIIYDIFYGLIYLG